MPAVLDLTLDAPERPTIYPARLHGAACALFGHPAPGGRPRFAVAPPAGHDGGLTWRLGWLDSAPCPRTLPTVAFGDTKHALVELTVREWSYAELTVGPTARRVDVEVFSPMYFSRGDRDHPAPDAVLALRSLLDRWDAHAPAALTVPAADRSALLSTVWLAGFDGRTVAGPVGRTTHQTGFVGTMTLALTRRADDGTATLFTALTRYAEIAGIGAQTGYGFGAVRVHPGLRPPARTDPLPAAQQASGALTCAHEDRQQTTSAEVLATRSVVAGQTPSSAE